MELVVDDQQAARLGPDTRLVIHSDDPLVSPKEESEFLLSQSLENLSFKNNPKKSRKELLEWMRDTPAGSPLGKILDILLIPLLYSESLSKMGIEFPKGMLF